MGAETAALNIVKWMWDNAAWVKDRLAGVRAWFNSPPDGRPILIIGPGGVGKSTLARILSKEHDPLTDDPADYRSDLQSSKHALADDAAIQLVVAPGQMVRRATWSDLLAGVGEGKFRGIVFVSAFGCHSLLGSMAGHPLKSGSIDDFRTAYFGQCRNLELAALRKIAEAMPGCPKKIWLLSLTVKQDIWANQSPAVERWYREGEFRSLLDRIASGPPPQRFMVEQAFASLVIANLRSTAGEVLARNQEGYDDSDRVKSLRSLLETIDALRKWEAEP